jgi:hypothetical protein
VLVAVRYDFDVVGVAMAAKRTTPERPADITGLFRGFKRPVPQTPKRKRSPKLGAFGRGEWLDLSEYVVHFTKGVEGDDGYRTMLSILGGQILKRGPTAFGAAKDSKAVDLQSQRVVCFSETPLGFLDRIVKRRKSAYGIGFHKRYVLKKGGGPLWYLQLGTPQQKALAVLIKRASKPFDQDDPIWKLTPFIDLPGPLPFKNDFRWEREWRLGDDLRFEPEDVAFLFIPENLHENAWTFFENAQNDHSGPAYFCPYVDPTWSVDKVREALKKAKEREPPLLNPRWLYP